MISGEFEVALKRIFPAKDTAYLIPSYDYKKGGGRFTLVA